MNTLLSRQAGGSCSACDPTNIDPDFSNCVDALILVQIDAIKEKKYQRYIESHGLAMQQLA